MKSNSKVSSLKVQQQQQLGHIPSGTATVRAHPIRYCNSYATSKQVQQQLGHIPLGTTIGKAQVHQQLEHILKGTVQQQLGTSQQIHQQLGHILRGTAKVRAHPNLNRNS